jgi:2-keto-4-pentenoate hydratase/2-oxohepta-3-ene-1,7-dioic acid hydratase in catechol pathway
MVSSRLSPIFDCAKLVSYLSECVTLLPGDLICTGTPPGVV